MSGDQTLLLPVTGLQPDYGPFTTAKPGALTAAQNVQLRTPGVIEPRGSFTLFEDAAMAAKFHQLVFEFGGALFDVGTDDTSGLTGGILRVNGSATVSGPASYIYGETVYAQAADRGHFTSGEGVQVLYDAAATTVRQSGLPRPVMRGNPIGVAPTWMPSESVVAYRSVHVRRTAQGTIYQSPPSSFTVIAFYGGGTASTQVVVSFLPEEFEVGDEIQFYRSVIIATPSTALPTDEMRLRYTHTVTAANITAKQVVFQDLKADNAWSGPALYTNATQEGISQSNWRIGYAGAMDYFNGMLFYGNNRSRQRFQTTVKKVGPGAPPAETFTDTTLSANATATLGSFTITGIAAADQNKFFVGQYISAGSSGPTSATSPFQAFTKITAVAGASVTIDKAATASVSAIFRVWDWISVTVGGNVYEIFPSSTSTVLITGQYFIVDYIPVVTGTPSPSNAEVAFAGGTSATWHNLGIPFPGVTLYADNTNSTSLQLGVQYLFESQEVNGPAFVVKSTKPLAFDKYIDSVTGMPSDTDYGPGYLFWSKSFQPEAVPLGNFTIVGSELEPILKLVATRDSLWVFKTDGLFRVSGDTPQTLRVDSFDPTCRMVTAAPQLATKYGNDVYVWNQRGIYKVNDGGVQPIDDGIRQFLGEEIGELQASAQFAFAAVSLTDRWVMFRPKHIGPDGFPAPAYIYWVDTDSWTTWTFPVQFDTGGAEFFGDTVFAGAQYLGIYEVDYTVLAPSPFPPPFQGADQVTLASITGSFVGDVMTHDLFAVSGFDAQVGDLFDNGANFRVMVTEVLSLTTCRVARDPSVVDGTFGYYRAFPVRVLWSAVPGAGLGVQSQFRHVTVAFDRIMGGMNFTYEFQGYQNPASILDPEAYSTTPSGYGLIAIPGVPQGIPLVEQRAVPRDGPRRDWGIKAGFQSQQAGQYFRTNGIAVLWSPAGDKVTR